ncbi:DegT/DnrJ/EryC1/StrS family aminotransferase [Aquimarina sp. M1]
MEVPFLDLKRVNQSYQKAFKKSFSDVLNSGQYILGNNLEIFEKQFAEYCGVQYGVGVGNGLDALTLLLRGYISLGKLNKGDNIVVASNTFIATILSIIYAGLEPILVEPEEHTYNLNPKKITAAITKDTRAIVVTHLYGKIADMEAISSIVNKYNLLFIDDAAQAHGAQDGNGKRTGNLCDATAFSFYPTKNLGALGDGGAITTNDFDLACITQRLRNYGKVNSYEFDALGYNSRLDELQAGFLSQKLPFLDQDNELRRKIARRYIESIKNPEIVLPHWDGSNSHVFHLFVVRVKERDQFCEYLQKHHIGYHLHYPIPPHLQKVDIVKYDKHFLLTEIIHNEVVSLPLFPGMTDREIDYVIEKVNQWKY